MMLRLRSPLHSLAGLIAGMILLAAFAQSPRVTEASEPFANPLLDELLQAGIVIDHHWFQLQPPRADPRYAPDRLDAAQRQIAGRRDWDTFTRNSVVAPIHMELAYLQDPMQRRLGIRIHFAFVLHTDIDRLRDPVAMQELLSAQQPSADEQGFQLDPIDPQTLMDLRVSPGTSDVVDESVAYGWLKTTLLNKVLISAVLRSQRKDEDSFFTIAWKLDERFTQIDPVPIDAPQTPADSVVQPRNEWRLSQRDDLGREVPGEPRPYQGVAGYLVVSRLVSVEGASLIEAEVILHEPVEWFGGSNLLRSKLPLILQESVRRLRRAF